MNYSTKLIQKNPREEFADRLLNLEEDNHQPHPHQLQQSMEMSDIDELFNQINPEDHPPTPAQQNIHQILHDNTATNMVSCCTYVVKNGSVFMRYHRRLS